MNMFSNKKFAAAAVVASAVAGTVVISEPAQAISVSLGGGAIDGSTLITFDTIPPFVPITYGDGATADLGDSNVTVLNGPASITPLLNPFADNRLTIGPSNVLTGIAEVAFDFDKDQRFLGFNWLNPNANETVSFFNRGGSLIQSFTAGSITGLLAAGSSYVSFFADQPGLTDAWARVVFSDPIDNTLIPFRTPTFEIDNLSYSNVPTPALLPGLIGMGVAALRKRRQEAEQEA